MITRKGILFVISGPSGVGKGTVRSAVLPQVDDMQISISATTRPPREGEIDGQDYFFTTPARFQQMIDNGELLEWASVYGNLYGTPQKEIVEALEQSIDMFLDIDVNGAIKVKERHTDSCLIFVEPPSEEELMNRLALRGEKEIALRMKRVHEEMEKKYLFQYSVINDKLENAYRDFKEIVETVRRRRYGKNHC
ncbi:MAG TPA: guanylate kinase [Syntrophorhabdus aromaticivorans]|nr:guanylate kinase [Syntrophorhabdus aromaticivorans]